jgi:hypothetical protein
LKQSKVSTASNASHILYVFLGYEPEPEPGRFSPAAETRPVFSRSFISLLRAVYKYNRQNVDG